jgi:hypothetical protein
MNDLLGVIDLLFGLFILGAMIKNYSLIHFPASHKIGLWLVSMGMLYHSMRNIYPDYFYDNVAVELSHIGLWIIVLSVGLKSWKNRKKAVGINS